MRALSNEELSLVAGGEEVYISDNDGGGGGSDSYWDDKINAAVDANNAWLDAHPIEIAPTSFTNCVAQQVCNQALNTNGADDVFSIPAAALTCLLDRNAPVDPVCRTIK